MTRAEKLKHCQGCYCDFYNGQGATECWMFDRAKLIWRKEVSMDQVPPWNQKAKLFLHCYWKQGFAYVQPGQAR